MKLKLFRAMLISALLSVSFVASVETVNINDASAGAMSHYLKGIGDIKAESIVRYRELNGDFKSLDDLVNVKGVGKGLLKKSRDDLSLTEGVVKWVKTKPKPKFVVIKSKVTKEANVLSSKKLAAKSVNKIALKKDQKSKEAGLNIQDSGSLKARGVKAAK